MPDQIPGRAGPAQESESPESTPALLSTERPIVRTTMVIPKRTAPAAASAAPPAPPLAELKGGAASSQPPSGFDGQLKRAKLADLVQLECLSGAKEAVAIFSEGRRGHLFFEGGAVVHACTPSQVGNAAALEILGWSRGTFAQSPLPWPARHTITMTWQELLMRTGGSESSQVAAPPSTRQSSADLQPLLPSHDASGGTGQTRAEGGATQAPQPTVAGEARRSLSASSAVRPAYVQTANLAQPTPPSSKRPPPLPSAALRAGRASSPGLPRASILGAMLLDRSGGVLVQQGETARLDGKAHGLQTALDKLGEALGLNAFSAFECSLPGRKLMLFRNATGATVAVETPAGADLHEVREALERS